MRHKKASPQEVHGLKKLPMAGPVLSLESGAQGRKREAPGAGQGERGWLMGGGSVDGEEDGVRLYFGGTTGRTS